VVLCFRGANNIDASINLVLGTRSKCFRTLPKRK
jgi:hypothetical protein